MRHQDSNSELLANEAERSTRFQHNEKLNELLAELKELLTPAQEQVSHHFDSPKWPLGLILGPPRSGSTVFLQFLAGTRSFSYPSNLMTRFAYAPHVGALIQKLLFDPEYDYQGDFGDIQSEMTYESDLGKSKGALATNEFFHFWRNYFPNFDPDWLSADELINVKLKECFQATASIEAVFDKPFVAKGWMFQFNLDYFYERMAPAFFFWVKRDPSFVMQSILWARSQFYNDRGLWLSMKPKEYEQLKEMDIYYQIAGQVYYTEKAIDMGLKSVPDANKLVVKYESFCADPSGVYRQIIDKYDALGCDLPADYIGPKSFECGNKHRLPKEDVFALQAAYNSFVSGEVFV